MVAGKDTNPSPNDGQHFYRYWVWGLGSFKIRWGTPGDFDRCRAQVGRYIQGRKLDGFCAKAHKMATGGWPGDHNADGKRDH